MINKEYLLTHKNTQNKEVQSLLHLSSQEAALLYESGFDIVPVSSMHVHLSEDFINANLKTPWKIYLAILWKDILKGKVFNKLRYLLYLSILKQSGVQLTPKQEQALSVQVPTTLNNNSNHFINISKDKKIILLSSGTANIGKSTFAKNLITSLNTNNGIVLPVASDIRDICSFSTNVFGFESNIFDYEYYNQNKNKLMNHNSNYKDFVIRDLVCDVSNTLQKHFGDDCWAKSLINRIDNSYEDVIIIDDIRRDIEINALISKYGKENILCVYLNKEDMNTTENNKKLSTVASSFEGQVNPDTYDVTFTFNKDWSNTDQLITTIKDKLNIN